MRAVTPQGWAGGLSGPPLLTHEGRRSGLIRRWRGTEAAMSRPPLAPRYVVLHPGRPERVTRTGDGRSAARDVDEGAPAIVPAGTRPACGRRAAG